MSGISIGGLASGLPPNIVEQLMQAERVPIQNMEIKKQKQGARLDLVNDLEGRILKMRDTISGLTSRSGFTDMKLMSSREDIITGAVDPKVAKTGHWNLEVRSLAEKAGVISNGFPDKDETEVGVGYIKFDMENGEEKEVYIGGEGNTLSRVAQTINRADAGVSATVINDRSDSENSYRLLISGTGVGDDEDISFPTLYFLDGDQDIFFEREKQAKNAVISLDGFEFELNDNKLEDVIPGVTLNLHQAVPGQKVALQVTEDSKVIEEKVGEFIASVNSVLKFIQKQNAMDANTDTSKTLGGDSLIRQIESRLRSLIQSPKVGTGSSITRLNEIGITYNRGGLIDLNSDKLGKVLAEKPKDVQRFLSGDGLQSGFITEMKRVVGSLLDSNFGPISNRKRSLQNRIRRIDNQVDRKEKYLDKREKSLRRKFARVEEMMSKLKTQGNSVGMIK